MQWHTHMRNGTRTCAMAHAHDTSKKTATANIAKRMCAQVGAEWCLSHTHNPFLSFIHTYTRTSAHTRHVKEDSDCQHRQKHVRSSGCSVVHEPHIQILSYTHTHMHPHTHDISKKTATAIIARLMYAEVGAVWCISHTHNLSHTHTHTHIHTHTRGQRRQRRPT